MPGRGPEPGLEPGLVPVLAPGPVAFVASAASVAHSFAAYLPSLG